METENITKSFNSQGTELAKNLSPVMFLTFIFFLSFVGRQLAGPLLPAIEEELGLSHTQSGMFILLIGSGFCLSQLGAAFLAAKWGYRHCILLSLWGSAIAALLIGYMQSVWLLYPGFFFLGMAGGLYVPSGISLITVLVHPKDWGKAISIHELAPNLALILVPFLATIAVILGSWRWGFIFCAAALAALGAVYLRAGVDADKRPSPPSLKLVGEVVAKPSFWQLSILLSLAVGVETGVYTMTPLFLVSERGYDLAQANLLLGLSRIPSVILVLLSGWLTDRLSPSTAISIALGVTGVAIVCLGMGPGTLLVPAIFIQAAASACLFPPILSMASGNSSTESRALTFSLSLAVAPIVGGGLLPAGIAIAGDLLSFGAGMVGFGILTIAGVFLVKH